MSEAQAILAELRKRGVSPRSSDGRLRYRPVAAVSPELRARLASQKTALLDLVERFEERAAIIEHDAGVPRAEAEQRAWASVLGEEVAP